MMTHTLILALSLGLTPAPAIAAPDSDTVSVQVRTADLDLTTARDQQRLEQRVTNAARRLCRAGGARGVAEMAAQAPCIEAALSSARPQADRAIAQANNGTRLALLMIRSPR
ncbi:MAG: UrcA family protein [Sphingopyxis sp.]|nr:UrcA family protein [Sphingopyxis sp.]